MTREEAIEYWEGLRKTFSSQLEKEENHFGRMHLQTTIDVLDTTISALRQQECVGDANKALTLDELRQMAGEPVWVVWTDGRIESKWWIVNSGWWMDMFWDDHGNISNDYGTVWLAYRQKPEE